MRFTTSSLYQKTCNISSDEDYNQIVDTGLFKRLVSGDRISAEFKGKDRFEFFPVATMLILINNDIPFNDHSYGLRRRLMVIDFPNEFKPEKNNSNVNLVEVLCLEENLQYIVFKALYFFANVLKTQKFTEPESVCNSTKKYMLNNNPVVKFIEDNPLYEELETPKEELYKTYVQWATSNCEDLLNPITFGKIILNKQCGFKAGRLSNGDRLRTYIGPKYDESKVWSPYISACDLCDYSRECPKRNASLQFGIYSL